MHQGVEHAQRTDVCRLQSLLAYMKYLGCLLTAILNNVKALPHQVLFDIVDRNHLLFIVSKLGMLFFHLCYNALAPPDSFPLIFDVSLR